MNDLSGIGRQSDFDVEACRKNLRQMSDAELLKFGKEMHDLVYPLRYGFDGKPVVCAFSIQLDEARAEWKRRKTQTATPRKTLFQELVE